MKKFLLLLLLFPLLCSCSKDDEETTEVATLEYIRGGWNNISQKGVSHAFYFNDDRKGSHAWYNDGKLDQSYFFTYELSGKEIILNYPVQQVQFIYSIEKYGSDKLKIESWILSRFDIDK